MLLHRKNDSRDASSRSLTRVRRPRRRAGRIVLDPEQELGIDEKPLEGPLDAGFEAPVAVFAPARVVERQQRIDVGVGHRTAVGAARERRQ